LTCLLAGYAVAQQQSPPEVDDAQTLNEVRGANQTDRAGAQNNRLQQRQSGTVQRTQLETRQSQFGQRGAQDQAGQQSQGVERFLAACLLAKNRAEIELSQLAQQQAQSPQVKEFAQQMIQDHQQLVQQLQQVAGQQGGQNDLQRQTSESNRLPGSPGAGQTESRTNRNLTAAGGAQDSGPIEQLIQLDRQIVQRQTESAKEMLQQKQGNEFDKAFLGMAIHAHANMKAALETIEQQQQLGQLPQIAQQASPVVEQHLQHAKQLMQQQERGSQAGARAERQTPGTQRQRQ
jgi:predicted outer membrane protein